MMRSISINNKYFSHNNKKSKIKNKSNNSCIFPIKKISQKSIKPIKIFPRNNTYFNHQEETHKSLEEITPINKKIKNEIPYQILNLSNKNKLYRTLDVNNSPNKKGKNNVKHIIYRNKDNNIFKVERFLTQNEKRFRRNISQKIISNQKLNNRLFDNISLLKNKIDNNYSELRKSKYNFYNDKKSLIETIINDKNIRLQNISNNKKIYDLKNEIINIQNNIERFKKLTNIYINNYMIVNEEINNLKEQNKIMPEVIKILEIENKNLLNNQMILHSKNQKIKLKILELEHNKRNIERAIRQTNMVYESNI